MLLTLQILSYQDLSDWLWQKEWWHSPWVWMSPSLQQPPSIPPPSHTCSPLQEVEWTDAGGIWHWICQSRACIQASPLRGGTSGPVGWENWDKSSEIYRKTINKIKNTHVLEFLDTIRVSKKNFNTNLKVGIFIIKDTTQTCLNITHLSMTYFQ